MGKFLKAALGIIGGSLSAVGATAMITTASEGIDSVKAIRLKEKWDTLGYKLAGDTLTLAGTWGFNNYLANKGIKRESFGFSSSHPSHIVIERGADCTEMFKGCKNFEPKSITFTGSVCSCKSMFEGCKLFNCGRISNSRYTSNGDIAFLPAVGDPTGYERMFFGCESFNQNIEIPDVERHYSLAYMLANCYSFDALFNIPHGVNNCEFMLFGCKKFCNDSDGKIIVIRSTVKNCRGMFAECERMHNLPYFCTGEEGPLDMEAMFYGCRSLPKFTLPERAFNAKFAYANCVNITRPDSENEAPRIGESLYGRMGDKAIGMFYGCPSTLLDTSEFKEFRKQVADTIRDKSLLYEFPYMGKEQDLKDFGIAEVVHNRL